MKINQTHQYDQNLDAVFALFADADFMAKKYTTLGARNFKAKTVSLEDSHLLVDTRREVPVDDNTPAPLKKFVGEWNRARQKEEWNKQADGWHCNFKVEISGVPARINGTMHLCQTEKGCENVVTIDISSSIPFVGNALCNFIGKNVDKLVRAEYKVIKEHLESVSA
ncbi:DUF2505 domain-containing protein [Candidatus Sororendozoicomonas aggregata]|uniref:DUF2505 domain-containing protein n=1 Tax=Candidatus Sororendozoicomonas aggregata TaxID=3073239 RepID=UPI002ECFB41A